jgi:colicin import membrane protein
VKSADAKAEPKTPDFAKDIARISKKRETRVVAKFRQEQKIAAEKAAKEEARISYQQFLKEQAGKTSPSQKAPSGSVKVSKIDTEGILKGVVGGSTSNKTGGAGGKALTREEQDRLTSYFGMLIARLKEAHEKPTGLSDLLSATVQFYIAADGSISRVAISRSSGNAEFDQSVLAAFRKIAAMPRRPDERGDVREVTFRMRDEE